MNQGMIVGLAHIQLAMPAGGEGEARRFYGELLGLAETEKPEGLRGRGGVWFLLGTQQLHLGVEKPFTSAKKAHPAIRVIDIGAFADRFEGTQTAIRWDDSLPDHRRFFTEDPFGNRLEFLESLL